jgi:hypothetical protein
MADTGTSTWYHLRDVVSSRKTHIVALLLYRPFAKFVDRRCAMKSGNLVTGHVRSPSNIRWFFGMMMATIFCLVYLMTPLYLLSALLAVLFAYPSRMWAIVFSTPIILSMAFNPIASPWVVGMLYPMLEYFEYEQILETKPVDARQKILDGTNYIIGAQAHGVISFCGICSAIYAEPQFRCKLPTAVASAVMHCPIIKHVMGIFGLIDASKENIQKTLKKPGVHGCVVIYVGGIAELFMSSPDEERLFLSQRKGFIKLSLTEGVDVVPVYLFGNTSVLKVLKTGILASLSRKLQVSLTYFWGKYYLPIPLNEKVRKSCNRDLIFR